MTPVIPHYSTHFTLDFSQRADGHETTEADRIRVLNGILRDEYLSEYFTPETLTVAEHGTTSTDADWPPEGPDGYEAAFSSLSAAFPEILFLVFGWGTEPTDAWECSHVAGEAQFATASVVAPPRLELQPESTPEPTGDDDDFPACPECGARGPWTVYFSPRVFKATVNEDLSVNHHGLVYDGKPDHTVECEPCSTPHSLEGLSILEHH